MRQLSDVLGAGTPKLVVSRTDSVDRSPAKSASRQAAARWWERAGRQVECDSCAFLRFRAASRKGRLKRLACLPVMQRGGAERGAAGGQPARRLFAQGTCRGWRRSGSSGGSRLGRVWWLACCARGSCSRSGTHRHRWLGGVWRWLARAGSCRSCCSKRRADSGRGLHSTGWSASEHAACNLLAATPSSTAFPVLVKTHAAHQALPGKVQSTLPGVGPVQDVNSGWEAFGEQPAAAAVSAVSSAAASPSPVKPEAPQQQGPPQPKKEERREVPLVSASGGRGCASTCTWALCMRAAAGARCLLHCGMAVSAMAC